MSGKLCAWRRRRWISTVAVILFVQAAPGHAAQPAPADRITGSAAAGLPAGAVLSPDGQRAIWGGEDSSSLWAAERPSGVSSWSAPRRILSVRGMVRHPVFSPDGRRVAFENVRGGHATGGYGPSRHFEWAFIGTYDFDTSRIAYVNPSFARDSDPQWSADGKQISYTRRMDGMPGRRLTSPAADRACTECAGVAAYLAAPLVYQPAVSGDGRSFAFVAREGAKRSIYFTRVGGATTQIVQYPDDDGQELSDVALSPTGDLLVYVRGGPENAKGEIPNPRLVPDPPERELWLVETANGRSSLLGSGAQPQFSPDGKRLIWTSHRGVMVADRASGFGQSEPLLAGAASTLRFSPDGTRLAFERFGHVQVLDLGSQQLFAVARPADAQDAGPVWSPDGGRIAFRRTVGPQPPRLGEGYAGEFVSKQPWEIWTADAATGEARRAWAAQPGIGSAYYALDQDPTGTGAAGEQLLWSANGAIVFVWERDGWRHLYAVPSTGGDAVLLTPGEGEVETAALSLDGQQVLFSTNIGDLPRRHIARVAVTGGRAEPVTTGPSSQWAPTPIADGGLVYVDAGWAVPPRVVVKTANATSTLAVPAIPVAFRSAKLVEPRPVEFPGTDGQTAYGQLFTPAKSRGCGVIFVHGGIRRQMLLGFHYMDAYSNLYELNQYFVGQGCAVLSVEYRSSIMRGYAFRNAPGWGSAGASEYKDVLGGAQFLKAQKQLHIDRIGIFGLSWGGYLTAQALARNSDVFAAGFDMAGVHEFTGKGFEHSPAAFVDQWRSPLYLAQGDDDRNVDFNQGVMLAQALRSKRPGVELVEHVFPNETHDLYLTFEDLVGVYQAGSDFLLSHLTGQDRGSKASAPAN